MDCQKARQMMNEAVDGRLDAGSRAQLEAHLVICPSCREEYRQISALHRDMQALPEETLPQEARRAYRAEIKKDRGPLQWKRYASVAAVLCMMVAGIYFAQDISRQHEERVENVSSSQGYVNRDDAAADAEDIASEEDAQAQELAKYLYDQGEMMGIPWANSSSISEDAAEGIWSMIFDTAEMVIQDARYSDLPEDYEYQFYMRQEAVQIAYDTGMLYEVTNVPLEKVTIHAEQVGLEWYPQIPVLVVDEQNLGRAQLLFYKLGLPMTLEPGMVICFYSPEG